MSPYTATDMVWRRLEAMTTAGVSESSGKEVMRSTSLLTSWARRSTSAPARASIVTVPAPSTEEDVTFLTPSRPVTRSSMARTMPFSTSSGLAPG
ncbi:hypothetical protein DSECCO2_570110 [anaerobic digester metagenome]